MLTEVKEELYQDLIPYDVHSDIAFAKATAQNLNFKYFIYFENEIPIIGFIIYFNYKNITSTNLFTVYNGFWIKETLREKKINQVLIESLDFLKSNFKNIKIVLPTFLKDVRAFKWSGFDVEIRYTYIKNLKDLNFKSDVKRNYAKALQEFDLILYEDLLNNSLWINYNLQLSNIGFSIQKINLIFKWLTHLEQSHLVKTFVVKENNDYAGSAIVLLDHNKRNAFLLYNHTILDHSQSQKTAFLYIEIHKWLSNNNYNNLDYLGANFKNIAEFKSNFNPELVNYFIVTYNSRLSFFRNLKKYIKDKLKLILRK
jgi:hypothetical protein